MHDGDDDLPFHDGSPVNIAGLGWLVVMASLAIAFICLLAIPLRTFPYDVVPAALFVIIPLAAVRQVAGEHWRPLFRPVTFRSILLIVSFGAATLVGSMAMGCFLMKFFAVSAHPSAHSFAAMSNADLAFAFLVTCIQLLGEELLGILSFLGTLWFCMQRLHLSRQLAILISLIVSGLIGAARLSTYEWHWAQSLIGIGFVRVILTLAYVTTRNLWVSFGAHVINDWTGLMFVLELGHVPIGTET